MQSFDWLTLAPALPEIFLFGAAIMLLMLGAFKGNDATHAVGLGVLLSLLVASYLIGMTPQHEGVIFNGMFAVDGFTQPCKTLLLLGAVLTLIISFDWLRDAANRRFEFSILILLSVLGMMMMISANDLMATYMGLELSSLALYVLAAFSRDSLKSSEAGLKYFVLGSLASGMMLFGMSLVYGFSGSTGFATLAAHFSQAHGGVLALGVLAGMVMVIVGFCFKISAAPFHMWTPDVYEGAPTPVTAFFAVAPKIAAVILLVRILLGPFGHLETWWVQVIAAAFILSTTVGAFGAIMQGNIKRLLAYSSIGHVGYILLGLAAASAQGVQAIVIYLAIYIFMSVGTFACVLLMRRRGVYVEDINELAGLAKTWPSMAFALAVFMFSMAGIPPLAGFFGKFYIFKAALDSGLVSLAIFGVVISVVGCFYYIKIVKLMYFDEAKEPFDRDIPLSMHYILLICTAFTLLFIFAPSPLIGFARTAAAGLLP